MSMYRQLWLAIIISTLLALGGSLLASTLAARAYLSQQLTLKNADNATTLALAQLVELTSRLPALLRTETHRCLRRCRPATPPQAQSEAKSSAWSSAS